MEQTQVVQKSPYVLDMNSPALPTKLYPLLGMASANHLYIEMDAGRILNIRDGNPHGYTYIDCIISYNNYFKEAEEAKRIKAQAEAELALKKQADAAELKRKKAEYDLELAKHKAEQQLKHKLEFKSAKFAVEDGELDMHPVLKAKHLQNIKTERARESMLWLDQSIKRGEFVSFAGKLSLITPFIMQISDLLKGIAFDFPETQSKIDEGMETLHSIGVALIEEAKEDAHAYVEEMLNMEIDVDAD